MSSSTPPALPALIACVDANEDVLLLLRDRLVEDGIDRSHLRELSMGMSHDFEVAIQEGATLVRVGTAIFGKRIVRT